MHGCERLRVRKFLPRSGAEQNHLGLEVERSLQVFGAELADVARWPVEQHVGRGENETRADQALAHADFGARARLHEVGGARSLQSEFHLRTIRQRLCGRHSLEERKLRDFTLILTDLYFDQHAQPREGSRLPALETALARVSLERVQRREPQNIYHKMSTAELAKLAPSVTWNRYFADAGAPSFQSLNVAVPEFFKGVEHLLNSTDLESLKTYLRWHAVHAARRSQLQRSSSTTATC